MFTRHSTCPRLARLLAAGAILAAAPSFHPAFAQVSFTGIGFPTDYFTSRAQAISRDGRYVAGLAASSTGQTTIVRWSAQAGMEVLGQLEPPFRSEPTALNADGSVIVGWGATSDGARPFRLAIGGAFENLGAFLPDALSSFAFGVSDDGRAVAGWSNSADGDRAFRWTPGGGLENLGVAPGMFDPQGFAISGNGEVVVGEHYLVQGFRWSRATGMVDLGLAPESRSPVPMGVNFDGSVIVGRAYNFSNRAFRWTLADGFTLIQPFPGDFDSVAIAVSSDGSIVLGVSSPLIGDPRFFLWSAPTGAVELIPFLLSRGIDLTGWQLTDVTGLSGDGLVICGNALHNDVPEGWVARLGRRCVADMDDGSATGTPDGGVTIDDLLYYLLLFENGAVAADVDNGTFTGTPDGGVTIDDLLYYLFRFEAGC